MPQGQTVSECSVGKPRRNLFSLPQAFQMLLCAGVKAKRFLKLKVKFRRFRKEMESLSFYLSFYSFIYVLVHWRELTSDLFSLAHG